MAVISAFQMVINYGQVAVHRPDEPEFFTTWTQADVDRGRIARDGHVVFGVDDHDGMASVTVSFAEATAQPADVDVPFRVTTGGVIITTPVGFDHHVALPAGLYDLSCEITPLTGEGVAIGFRFRKVAA